MDDGSDRPAEASGWRPQTPRSGLVPVWLQLLLAGLLCACTGEATDPDGSALSDFPPATDGSHSGEDGGGGSGDGPGDGPGAGWRLVAFVSGDGGAPVAPAAKSTLSVDQAGGGITGLAGCNRYRASYRFEGTALSVGAVAATKRMCAEPQMAQEARFLAWLGRASSVHQDGATLVIRTIEGEALRFERTDGA